MDDVIDRTEWPIYASVHYIIISSDDCMSPMMTSSNGNIFRVTGAAGNSLVTGGFPSQGPVTRSFGVLFDLRLDCWVNNRVAGYLRRHPAHYDTAMACTALIHHYNHVIMSTIASQITSLTIVHSTVYPGAENIKAPRHWPLCGEFTGDRWIPRTNGQ